jgi:H+/gluconate symporter-like permease
VSTSLVSALSASETKPTTKQETTIQESHICIAPGHSKNLQKYHRSLSLSLALALSLSLCSGLLLAPMSLLQHKAKEKKPEPDKQNKQSNKQERKKKQQNPKMSTNQSNPPTYLLTIIISNNN